MNSNNNIQMSDSIDSALAGNKERSSNPHRISTDKGNLDLKKLMYLYENLSAYMKKKWELYSDDERYDTLSRKYKRSCAKHSNQVPSNLKKIDSPVLYIINLDLDYFKLDIEELKSLQEKLKTMVEDIDAARELYTEGCLVKDIAELRGKADSPIGSRGKYINRVASKLKKIGSPAQYIINLDLDYLKLDIDELISLQEKLKTMVEDIGAAKELYKEEYLVKDIAELRSKADSLIAKKNEVLLPIQAEIDKVQAEIAGKEELMNKYLN